MRPAIPDELPAFLAQHLRSVEQLEVLLLLQRFPDRTWTTTEVARELRANETSIGHWLAELTASNLAAGTPAGHRFQPASMELRRLAALLADVYRERPVPIIECLYRPRSPLQDFSQAFKIRKQP